jgi:O-antigen/teichoic acid export membrane protein
LNLFKKTPFFSLLSGSILAQAVTLISMPFISKLYGPTEIGLISIFISFLTIPSALSLFKLEGVLLIYTDNRQIKGIWLIYLLSMFVVSSITIIAFFIFYNFKIFGINTLPIWSSLFIFLFVFVSGFSFIIKTILIRNKDFHDYSKIIVIRNILNVLIKSVGGLLSPSFLILLFSELLSFIAFFLRTTITKTNNVFFSIKNVKRSDIIESLVYWKKFPLLETPSIFLDQVGQVVPLLILAQKLGPHAAGLFAIAYKITFLPSTHLGATIAEIFRGQFSHFYREKEIENAKKLLYKTLIKCILIAIIFYLPIYFFMPSAVVYIFGNKWVQSSELIHLLVPWAATSLIVSTLSPLFSVMQTQSLKLIYDVSSVILLTSSVYLINVDKLLKFTFVLSSSAVIANLIYFLVIYFSYKRINRCVA